jgi:hypothetical protein
MNTNGFENGEVRVDLVQEMRVLAERGADVPDLVTLLQQRLVLSDDRALFASLAYFRAAFCISLREALPLREWLGARDRSEVDSVLIPAMKRTKPHWQAGALQRV